MPESRGQRWSPRYAIPLKVSYTANAPEAPEEGIGWVYDLSEGGACLELPRRLPPQTPLHLCVGTDHGSIEMDAKVIWVGMPASAGGIYHGVAFTRLPAEHRAALRRLLRSARGARDLGARLPLRLDATCLRRGQEGPPLQGWTGMISHGGLLLFLPEAVIPGMHVEVTLHIGNERLTVWGKIAWLDPPETRRDGKWIAHGLRFSSLKWLTPLLLAYLLEPSRKGPHP